MAITRMTEEARFDFLTKGTRMTKEDLYDLALKKGIKDPAVFVLGDRCFLGEWIDITEPGDFLLRTETKGVRLIAATVNGEHAWTALAAMGQLWRTGGE